MAITLGCHDPDIPRTDVDALFEGLRAVSGDPAEACLIGDTGDSVYPEVIAAGELFSVAEVQAGLSRIGFFPGARVDGICGYRTHAAIRLFQEYVRSVEGRPCPPDGKFGPATGRELRRWLDGGLSADWLPRLERWREGTLGEEPGEFGDWLSLLEKVKAHRLETPGALLEKVDAFEGDTDTRRVVDWAFADRDIHLIGVRRRERRETHTFDDVMILLLKGLVFEFQGSTDPGFSARRDSDGAPFLVPGQHRYRFGLHRGSYHALRPRRHGVLVLRSKGDYALTESDLAGALEANATINIHWGGRGVARNVNRWSEGCQVIAGSGYRNHAGEVILCSDVAVNNGDVKRSGGRRTRGAYNVLSDLVVALSNDMPSPGGVSYTLLEESDLALEPAMAERMVESRRAAVAHFGLAS